MKKIKYVLIGIMISYVVITSALFIVTLVKFNEKMYIGERSLAFTKYDNDLNDRMKILKDKLDDDDLECYKEIQKLKIYANETILENTVTYNKIVSTYIENPYLTAAVKPAKKCNISFVEHPTISSTILGNVYYYESVLSYKIYSSELKFTNVLGRYMDAPEIDAIGYSGTKVNELRVVDLYLEILEDKYE